MSEINITIDGGTSKRLLTAGKMCDRNILVTATGGSSELPDEAFTITSNCNYRFSNNGWNWFINEYGNRINTSSVEGVESMFYGSSDLENIPFDININLYELFLSVMFCGCSNLKTLPTINSESPIDWSNNQFTMEQFLSNCQNIRYADNLFSESFFDNYSNRTIQDEWTPYTSLCYIFNGCTSLRAVPNWYYKLFDVNENSNFIYAQSTPYSFAFQYCKCLDEIIDLPVLRGQNEAYENMFSESFYSCNRLKNMTFKTQEDGTPYTANWSNQIIDLSYFVGYATNSYDIYRYNSGIDLSKIVDDDASYQALKNDPDWFTLNDEYSRYNHDSAVATINSLPDTTSASGGNTIMFKSSSGANTDGGAISNLTEEEIAVATAKGWTVSLV